MILKKRMAYIAALTLMAACVPPKQTVSVTKVEPAQPVSVEVVDIVPLKGTELSQKKSNVTVRIEAINDYAFHWDMNHYYTKKPETIKLFNLQIRDGKEDYVHKVVPALKYDNPAVRFKVTINNQSDKVVRTAGSVLTIDVDGKNIPVESGNISNYITAIIVPSSSKEMIISPFSVGTLTSHNKGTIRFGLYELRVGDKLETFEWYFDFKKVVKKIKGEPTVITEEHLYPFNVQTYGKVTKGPKATILE